MCQRTVSPLQALRACGGLALWPLEQRLAAKAADRRWREAIDDPELWQELDVPAALAAALPLLLRHHGQFVRRLTAAAHLVISPERRFAGLLPGLAACSRLVYLSLRGLGGPELMRCTPPVAVPSLRELVLSYTPYFILSNYSHHTGVPGATVSMDWVALTFPKLEELTCDYLQVGSSPSALPSLRRLSLVAVVRSSEGHWLWGSEGCNRDLPAVARAAGHLERLDWRDPRLHLGRMSWRPSQSAEDLFWLCRRFCALDPALMADARRRLPRLRHLEVATVREDADFDLEALDLAQFLGLGGTGGAATAAAEGASVEELQFRLHLGGLSEDFADRWRAAVRRVGPSLEIEVSGPPAPSPPRPRMLLPAIAEASFADLLQRRFPAALRESDDEASASWRSNGGSFLGSPAPSSADADAEEASGEGAGGEAPEGDRGGGEAPAGDAGPAAPRPDGEALAAAREYPSAPPSEDDA
mmetsp:Transcript_9260/g.29433  ORF Transcript_9260/g.29433 Transcript_9260/m.29433 type:complete len:472 (-) Transcript_9260:27-1442(-)